MARVNEHYLKLKAGYLFPEIGRRVRAFADGFAAAKARTRRPISGKRYPAFSLR